MTSNILSFPFNISHVGRRVRRSTRRVLLFQICIGKTFSPEPFFFLSGRKMFMLMLDDKMLQSRPKRHVVYEQILQIYFSALWHLSGRGPQFSE